MMDKMSLVVCVVTREKESPYMRIFFLKKKNRLHEGPYKDYLYICVYLWLLTGENWKNFPLEGKGVKLCKD